MLAVRGGTVTISIRWVYQSWVAIRANPDNQYKPLAASTLKSYGGIPVVLDDFYGMPIDHLNQEWVTWCVAAMKEAGYKGTTITKWVNVITRFARGVEGMTLCPPTGDPIVMHALNLNRTQIPWVDKRPEQREDIDEEWIEELLSWCRRRGVAGQVAATCFFTGLRVGQILQLEYEQVEISPSYGDCAGIIRWRADQTKTRKTMTSFVWPELLAYWPALTGAGRMFDCSYEHVRSNVFAPFAEAKGVAINSHDMRRHLITRLFKAGVDVKTIGELVGQTSIATTLSYIKDTPTREKAIASARARGIMVPERGYLLQEKAGSVAGVMIGRTHGT